MSQGEAGKEKDGYFRREKREREIGEGERGSVCVLFIRSVDCLKDNITHCHLHIAMSRADIRQRKKRNMRDNKRDNGKKIGGRERGIRKDRDRNVKR